MTASRSTHLSPHWIFCTSDLKQVKMICDWSPLEAIGEIQLPTIDNVLKYWIDPIGYCMANPGSHLNEIIFHC